MGESGPEVDPKPLAPEFRQVVPGRAVLTELARGFLLVHETNPKRATQFALTFLQECAAPSEPTPVLPFPYRAQGRRGARGTGDESLDNVRAGYRLR